MSWTAVMGSSKERLSWERNPAYQVTQGDTLICRSLRDGSRQLPVRSFSGGAISK